MFRFFRLASAAAAMVLSFGVAAASAAGLPVAKQTLVSKTPRMEVTIEYPRTGKAAIDAVLAAYAHGELEPFRKEYESSWEKGQEPFYLNITYRVERNDAQIFAVVFTEDSFAGGAHPNQDTTTFNFLSSDGAQVFLPEIVGASGIARVSQLATADLIKRIGTGAEPMSDKETIMMGSGPVADNFKAFVWLPRSLHIYFPAYQVASYASGPQETTIPLAQLKGFIRPDWRAPEPSFDCQKAATPVEHAICADALLGRLDRQVAEQYQVDLKNAYDPAPQAALRQTQRDWIAKRNRTCGGPALGACLTEFYRDRLAVLRKPAQ